jgi:hypothetical protein
LSQRKSPGWRLWKQETASAAREIAVVASLKQETALYANLWRLSEETALCNGNPWWRLRKQETALAARKSPWWRLRASCSSEIAVVASLKQGTASCSSGNRRVASLKQETALCIGDRRGGVSETGDLVQL